MRIRTCQIWAFLALPTAVLGQGQHVQTVGPTRDGGHIVPTTQLIRPAGETIELAGRPVDIALAPDGQTLYVKDNRGLVVVSAKAWRR